MHPLLLGPLLLGLCAAPPPARAVPALPIAFAGDPVPGAPGEVFSSGLFGQVDDVGQVAMTGRYAGAFLQGIFQWDATAGGTPTPIVLPSDPAPDAPAGTELLSGFVQEMTGSGRFGYSATFATGPGGVTESTNRALYRFAPAAGHELLARDGDVLPGTSGSLVLDATPDIFPSFNAAGEAVFSGLTAATANLSDGSSGLFLLTIPEQGTGALLTIGTLTLAGARRAGTRSEP